MIPRLSVLTNLLLVSVASAVPSFQRGTTRHSLREEYRRSQPVEIRQGTTGVFYDNNWSGAVQNQVDGTFIRTTVSGTFVVPDPLAYSGSGTTIWVGIDGFTCESAILQTGVQMIIESDTSASYKAFFEWAPDGMEHFTNITVQAGDVINAAVYASSPTTGIAVVQNANTNQTVAHYFNSNYALCGRSVEWVVEDYEYDDSLISLTNFGTVTFKDATAIQDRGATYTPADSIFYNIQQGDANLTSVFLSGSDLTVLYTGLQLP